MEKIVRTIISRDATEPVLALFQHYVDEIKDIALNGNIDDDSTRKAIIARQEFADFLNRFKETINTIKQNN